MPELPTVIPVSTRGGTARRQGATNGGRPRTAGRSTVPGAALPARSRRAYWRQEHCSASRVRLRVYGTVMMAVCGMAIPFLVVGLVLVAISVAAMLTMPTLMRHLAQKAMDTDNSDLECQELAADA